MAGDAIITLTGDQIEIGRWLTVRSALKLEIMTGMKRSNRGRPTLVLANEITGIQTKSKKVGYKALDEKIVEALGPDFAKPLP